MTLIPLTCPLCSGVFQVDSAHAGTQVECPHCAKAVAVPAELAQPATIIEPSRASEAVSDSGPTRGDVSQADTNPTSPPPPSGLPDVAPPMMPDASPPAPAEPSAALRSSSSPAQASFNFPAPPPIPGTDPPASNSATPQPTSPSAAPPPATSPPPASDSPQQPDEPHLAKLTCPTCENLLRIPTDAAGGQVHCPTCNAIVDVPSILVEAPDVPDVEEIVAPEYQFSDEEETADEVIERGGIRHLSREERAKIRGRKNLFMLVAGFLLLFGVTFLLQHYETFFMDIYDRLVPEVEETEE